MKSKSGLLGMGMMVAQMRPTESWNSVFANETKGCPWDADVTSFLLPQRSFYLIFWTNIIFEAAKKIVGRLTHRHNAEPQCSATCRLKRGIFLYECWNETLLTGRLFHIFIVHSHQMLHPRTCWKQVITLMLNNSSRLWHAWPEADFFAVFAQIKLRKKKITAHWWCGLSLAEATSYSKGCLVLQIDFVFPAFHFITISLLTFLGIHIVSAFHAHHANTALTEIHN